MKSKLIKKPGKKKLSKARKPKKQENLTVIVANSIQTPII